MSAPGPMKREPAETPHQVVELSSSSDDEPEEQGKRPGSFASGSPWSDDSFQKKQRLQEMSEEIRDVNSPSDEMRDLNIEDASEDSNSPPALPQPPAVEELSRSQRKQFWKAGDYEGQTTEAKPSVGIERSRVHPKFLHANATCHRWALGAIAELVDNAMDEVPNGATFLSLDVYSHPKDRSAMLVVEDDGGGMNPNKVRQCMSLGYSIKSKNDEAIGQYGNGFKTSTMRLAADVIVFSRSPASSPSPATQSIGMLSYTYLRETGQDDVTLPIIDYELTEDGVWIKRRSASERWAHNLKTIQIWSPYITEEELLDQFADMKDHGTKIVLYNLWEDDQGQRELDFETDPYDVQIRGPNRDPKRMAMVQRFPNSRHCLTYGHSLRSYLSILYLRMPPAFKIILRRQEVAHHNVVDDLMYTKKHTYRPQGGPVIHGTKEIYMEANVVLGFTKDAKDHVNLQGFNVYHKNRLIKPFWKIWNSSGSEGRGIIGVLEANFVVPSHDKQGFERSLVSQRLETRLLQMQKTYWANNCHRVGYVGNKNRRPSFPYSAPFPPADIEVLNRGQASTSMGSRNEELRLSVPSNGTPGVAQQGVETSFSQQQGGPSRNSLADLGRMFAQRAAGPSEVNPSPQHVNQQHPASPSNGSHGEKEKEILRLLKEENARIREKCQKLEEAREQKLMNQVARNNRLQAKLLEKQQKRADSVRNIEDCIRERNTLHTTLEEERLQRMRDESHEAVQRMAQLRMVELESENHRLRSTKR